MKIFVSINISLPLAAKKHIIKIQKMSFFEVNYGANLFVLYILPVNMIPHMQP